MKLRGSNGCSGWRTTTRSRAAVPSSVRTVASTTSSSSPTGTAGGRAGVGALVVAGVGDDQPVGRGEQRVEQQLAVLAARVAVADVRVVEHQVVAVARRLAREARRRRGRAGTRPGAAPSASARSVQIGQVAGAEVGPGRAALQALGEQRADLGQRERRRARGRVDRRLVDHVVEQPLQLGALPGVARRSSR